MTEANPCLGIYPSLRDMAEDHQNGSLKDAVAAWWSMAKNASIADVLLLRACAELGILPDGVDSAEVIDSWKLPASAKKAKPEVVYGGFTEPELKNGAWGR